MNERVAKTTIHKLDGEWVVRAYNKEGERIRQADYYTNDKKDAEETAKLMVRNG